MDDQQIAKYCSWLGKRSYEKKLERLGIERIREIARQNGKLGGRPRKDKNVKVSHA
jgi:hypothetical protein